jgi:hypothetical protein
VKAVSLPGDERPVDILQVTNLGKRYGEERVLEGIAFHLFYGLLIGAIACLRQRFPKALDRKTPDGSSFCGLRSTSRGN